MQIVRLRKVGNSTTVTLPAWVVEALHLNENDEIAIGLLETALYLHVLLRIFRRHGLHTKKLNLVIGTRIVN